MEANKTFPILLPDNLYDCLRQLGHVIYYPNPGNLGDELIAASTVLLFERLGISFEIYQEDRDYGDAYTLVYGGGGVMVPEWGHIPRLIQLFSAPGLSRCVILPHSMRHCDELLAVMDARFTVFCREAESLSYCQKTNHCARFELAHDMAFYISPLMLPRREDMLAQLPPPNMVSRLLEALGLLWNGRRKLLCKFYRKTFARMQRLLPKNIVSLNDGRKAAFFLRCDWEKNENVRTLLHRVPTMDLSRLGGSDCRWHAFNLLGVLQMQYAIQAVDLIVTDRLHVAISAAMLGRECIMLDNTYRKLSGVYKQSMRGMPGITLCSSSEETSRILLPLLASL